MNYSLWSNNKKATTISYIRCFYLVRDYIHVDDLASIKNNLLAKKDKLSDEDKAWLERFRKY